MAEVVLSGVADDASLQGTLFHGMKLWLSQRVPQRGRFIQDVRANGGEVVDLEKQADVRIVDHARKEIPPGSHSYRFIEQSVRNGYLENLDDHKVGPPVGEPRSIGSLVQAPKGGRQKFTAEDDLILWTWVRENPQQGGGTRGNEIYKQLEQKHPHHPWQSWRDRWVKQLESKRPPSHLHNPPPTPPTDVPAKIQPPNNSKKPLSKDSESRGTSSRPPPYKNPSPKKIPRKEPEATVVSPQDPFASFTQVDADTLMEQGENFENIDLYMRTQTWQAWAKKFDDKIHTAQQWQAFWEEYVRPKYLRKRAKQTRRAGSTSDSSSNAQTPSPSKSVNASSPSVASPFIDRHPNPLSISRASSYHPESPSMQLTGRVLSQGELVSPIKYALRGKLGEAQGVLEAINEAGSLTYRPGSPEIPNHQLTSHAFIRQALKSPLKSDLDTSMTQVNQTAQENGRSYLKTPSPRKQSTKRKLADLAEELPSSSPPQQSLSPKRRQLVAAGLPLEIASTPQRSPVSLGRSEISTLLSELEQQHTYSAQFEPDSNKNGSPLGGQLSDTLSEPGQRLDDTQAVLRATSEPLDLDVAPPDEGWEFLEGSGHPGTTDATDSQTETSPSLVPPVDEDENNKKPIHDGSQDSIFSHITEDNENLESDGLVSDTQSQSIKAEPNQREVVIQETQAIFRAQTEPLDFTIAEPEGGWETAIPSSPPSIPGSPHTESEASSDIDAQMQVWIDEQVTAGVTADQAAWVLTCTSLDTGLAEEVVKHLAQTGEIPQGTRNVWTALDDENLQSTDARRIQRLEDKHGKEGIKRRWDFLDEMNS